MRLFSATAAAIRHGAGAAAEAALIAAIGVALVFGFAVGTGGSPSGAADINAAGKLGATIQLGSGSARTASVTAGTELTFTLTRTVPDNDPVMWVSQRCANGADEIVYALDLPVQWGSSASLEGVAGPFVARGVACRAYATLRPWRGSVLGTAELRFAVD
jgi:hypothetical protein